MDPSFPRPLSHSHPVNHLPWSWSWSCCATATPATQKPKQLRGREREEFPSAPPASPRAGNETGNVFPVLSAPGSGNVLTWQESSAPAQTGSRRHQTLFTGHPLSDTQHISQFLSLRAALCSLGLNPEITAHAGTPEPLYQGRRASPTIKGYWVLLLLPFVQMNSDLQGQLRHSNTVYLQWRRCSQLWESGSSIASICQHQVKDNLQSQEQRDPRVCLIHQSRRKRSAKAELLQAEHLQPNCTGCSAQRCPSPDQLFTIWSVSDFRKYTCTWVAVPQNQGAALWQFSSNSSSTFPLSNNDPGYGHL